MLQVSEKLQKLTHQAVSKLPDIDKSRIITDLNGVVSYLNKDRFVGNGLWSAKVNENGTGSISVRKSYVNNYESGYDVWGVFFKGLIARLSPTSGKYFGPRTFIPDIDIDYQELKPSYLGGRDYYQGPGMDFDGLVKSHAIVEGFQRRVILPSTFTKITAIAGIIDNTLVLTSEKRVYLDGLLEKAKSDLGSKAKQVQAIQARLVVR